MPNTEQKLASHRQRCRRVQTIRPSPMSHVQPQLHSGDSKWSNFTLHFLVKTRPLTCSLIYCVSCTQVLRIPRISTYAAFNLLRKVRVMVEWQKLFELHSRERIKTTLRKVSFHAIVVENYNETSIHTWLPCKSFVQWKITQKFWQVRQLISRRNSTKSPTLENIY